MMILWPICIVQDEEDAAEAIDLILPTLSELCVEMTLSMPCPSRIVILARELSRKLEKIC